MAARRSTSQAVNRSLAYKCAGTSLAPAKTKTIARCAEKGVEDKHESHCDRRNLAGGGDRDARRVFPQSVHPNELARDDEMSERGHRQSADNCPEHDRFGHHHEQSSDLGEL
jgi:hypothetical protein